MDLGKQLLLFYSFCLSVAPVMTLLCIVFSKFVSNGNDQLLHVDILQPYELTGVPILIRVPLKSWFIIVI